MLELTALFLAGLSLFFTGIGGVRIKLQQLSSRKFRLVLVRVTDRHVVAGLVGVAFGAVTQSASAVAFILSSMVATGLISVRRALPVVAASNVGTALLVFLAAFDMRLAILMLIGITGLMINFKTAPRFEALVGALFSIGLLFLGLGMMKEAFAPLPGYEWFKALADFLRSWSWAPFFLGAALRMVIQSSSAIGVIAIALQSSGLFTEFQAVMLICGAGPGVALAGIFLSGTLYGQPRQIVLYQGLINIVSGSLMAGIFFFSEVTGHGFLFQFIDAVALDASGRIAWAFFLNMSGCLLVGLALAPFIEPLLRKLAPATQEQDMSRLMFLHDEALQVPETAAALVDKEQQRLFALTLKSLDTIREETRDHVTLDEAACLSASLTLGREISAFLQELVSRELTSESASAVLLFERRQENLSSLAETVHQFIAVRKARALGGEFTALLDRMTESLHLILLTAQDAWLSGDAADIDCLLMLAADRGDIMERLRKAYQSTGSQGAVDQTSALFYTTTLFERMVWIVRQLGLSLQRERT